jgi:tetratricopeptide (TPR) repeat protein
MGSSPIELSLIGTLHKAQLYKEADDAIARYYLLHGRQDSTQIKVVRLLSSVEAQRCDEADSLFAAVRDEIDPGALNIFEGQINMGCQRFEAASAAYEKVWNENPFDAVICNNLAWAQTLLGRDLERAEELAELSILLSSDKAASRNTLGAIYVRRGEWDRARETFVKLCEGDDRPNHLAANEFFLGLCDYFTGNKKEGLERWQKIVKMDRIDSDVRSWAEKGLDLDSRGESVLGAVFVEIQEEK